MNKQIFILIMAAIICGCNRDEVILAEQGSDSRGYRPATTESSPYQNIVYEYTPAPGQFINETLTGGFVGDENTAEKAAAYAQKRLAEQKFVSLGAFGGYLVVGFDHSISNRHNGYDFVIMGNGFAESNEPGIVWVMQDTNANGQPDDVWYELRGSETGKPTTINDYQVTYFRPEGPGMDVKWTDNQGNSGTIDYLKSFHKQDYYYPAWIAEDSYTLVGTCLEPRNERDEVTGDWINRPYGWGYADNVGTDALTEAPLSVGFKISNVIDRNGQPVDLQYIDFVKIQQGVMAKSGHIGENSCEVTGVADASLIIK